MFRMRSDGVDVRLDERDRGLLGEIPMLLDSASSADDDARSALDRPAFRDDAGASAEFASMVSDEVARQRSADRAVLARVSSGATHLSRDDAVRLMRVVNEARIVLAVRRGILTDDPEDAVGWERRIEGDPALAALAWLSYVESELLRALPTVS